MLWLAPIIQEFGVTGRGVVIAPCGGLWYQLINESSRAGSLERGSEAAHLCVSLHSDTISQPARLAAARHVGLPRCSKCTSLVSTERRVEVGRGCWCADIVVSTPLETLPQCRVFRTILKVNLDVLTTSPPLGQSS